MLTATQVEAYRKDGFLVLPEVIPPGQVVKARAKLVELIEASRRVPTSNSIYDLEDAHTPTNPRVRANRGPA